MAETACRAVWRNCRLCQTGLVRLLSGCRQLNKMVHDSHRPEAGNDDRQSGPKSIKKATLPQIRVACNHNI